MEIIERWQYYPRDNNTWPLATMEIGEEYFVSKYGPGYKQCRSYVNNRGNKLCRRFSCKKTQQGMIVTRIS